MGSFTLSAQEYKNAVGVRFGGTSGLTYKHSYAQSSAIEGILGFFDNGISVTGLWERHPQAFNVERLHWYYGGGLHLAFYDEQARFGWDEVRDIPDRDDNDIGIGVDGIAGLEYKFISGFPLAVSLGIKPFVEFDTDGDVGVALDPGIGIKVLFD